MYNARVVFNTLTPLAPKVLGARKFASWLARSDPLVRTGQVMASQTISRHKSTAAGVAEPFLNGTTSSYVEEMYNAWLQDPSSVHIVCKTFGKQKIL